MTTEPPFQITFGVRDYECDVQGIVNNANYLHYLELTRHAFCEERGTSFRAMHEAGIDPVVRKIEIEYLNSLTMGDTVVSSLTVRREGARYLFDQRIDNGSGVPAARAVVTVAVLENGHISRGDAVARM
ncbi:MAG: acyl-CoA thioesterase, partial [Duncaniella sp.]|nr:acyl-CoA thioesterase [Duncaniella sp.]